MEVFLKIINGLQTLTIFTESFILETCLSGVFLVNLKHQSYVFLVFRLLAFWLISFIYGYCYYNYRSYFTFVPIVMSKNVTGVYYYLSLCHCCFTIFTTIFTTTLLITFFIIWGSNTCREILVAKFHASYLVVSLFVL